MVFWLDPLQHLGQVARHQQSGMAMRQLVGFSQTALSPVFVGIVEGPGEKLKHLLLSAFVPWTEGRLMLEWFGKH